MEKCASEKIPGGPWLFSGVPLFSHSVASVRWQRHSPTWPLATQCKNRGIFQIAIPLIRHPRRLSTGGLQGRNRNRTRTVLGTSGVSISFSFRGAFCPTSFHDWRLSGNLMLRARQHDERCVYCGLTFTIRVVDVIGSPEQTETADENSLHWRTSDDIRPADGCSCPI
jgi:hypothetical protein